MHFMFLSLSEINKQKIVLKPFAVLLICISCRHVRELLHAIPKSQILAD